MKRLYCLFALACLAGCSNAPVADTAPDTAKSEAVQNVPKANYGVFVGIGPAIETRLAAEAARQLWRLYPAPQYRLDFQQRITDTDEFGHLLIGALQRDGHIVRQRHDPAVTPQCDQKTAGKKSESSDFIVLPVCYLVDDVSGMLRLTLYTAGDTWNRFFIEEKGKLTPTGAWSYRKGE